MTEEQKTLASSDSVTESFENILNIEYETVDNPTAIWKSAGLNLLSKTTVRLKISYEGNVDDLTLIAQVDGGSTYEINEFYSLGDNQYYVYFDNMKASQFSNALYFKIQENGKIISNTLRYSVESYAARNKENEKMGTVLITMMKYGKAAQNYNSIN